MLRIAHFLECHGSASNQLCFVAHKTYERIPSQRGRSIHGAAAHTLAPNFTSCRSHQCDCKVSIVRYEKLTSLVSHATTGDDENPQQLFFPC